MRFGCSAASVLWRSSSLLIVFIPLAMAVYVPSRGDSPTASAKADVRNVNVDKGSVSNVLSFGSG
jgi:hypothetical protein